ncbi:MAG TPA: hypothetical protein VE177_06735, partial [Candidatus Binatus sp.]|nr:hypothetical protein [Candidatus Binatus sp.]
IFARHSLNGELSASQFERLNMALEYGDEMPAEEVHDSMAQSVINWLKTGGLENDWTEEVIECPVCSSRSFRVAGRETDIFICPSCEGILPDKNTSAQTEPPAQEVSAGSQSKSESEGDNGAQTVLEPIQEQADELGDPSRPSFDEIADEVGQLLQESLPAVAAENHEQSLERKSTRRVVRKDGWEYSEDNDSNNQS